MKPQYKQARTLVQFNTGTQIHKPKKGKGSYKRQNKIRGDTNDFKTQEIRQAV